MDFRNTQIQLFSQTMYDKNRPALKPITLSFPRCLRIFLRFLRAYFTLSYAFFRLSLNSSSAYALTHLSAYARATRILAHLHINAPLHSFRGARKVLSTQLFKLMRCAICSTGNLTCPTLASRRCFRLSSPLAASSSP